MRFAAPEQGFVVNKRCRISVSLNLEISFSVILLFDFSPKTKTNKQNSQIGDPCSVRDLGVPEPASTWLSVGEKGCGTRGPLRASVCASSCARCAGARRRGYHLLRREPISGQRKRAPGNRGLRNRGAADLHLSEPQFPHLQQGAKSRLRSGRL